MDGNILDGAITLVGRTDPYAGTLNAGITIERVTIDNPATGESFILQGEAEVTINDSGSARITENSTTTDNSTGKIYRFENLVANLSGLNDSPFVYTMAGRYYDSDHGYFTVSTPVAFEMSAYDPRPYTGVMLLVSDDGSKTRLTIIDTDAYVVDADTNGDGEYDWTSGVRHG